MSDTITNAHVAEFLSALRAGLPKERILNFMSYEELEAWRASNRIR